MSVFDGFRPYAEKRKIDSVVHIAADMLLSEYLTNRFSYRSHTEWLEEIAKGRFLLDGRRIFQDLKIADKAHLEYEFEPKEEPECDFEYKLLGMDDDFICISKSGNLPTHPAGRYYKNTLWYLLQDKFGGCAPVSRLDRETSGVLLFGRSPAAMRYFSKIQMTKKYHVIVHGEFPEFLDADGFMMRDEKSVIRKKRRFSWDAEHAGTENCRTVFRRICFKNGLSLVEAELKTGRTHQIRATCCSLGYPVAGDKMYGVDENIFLRFIDGRMTAEDQHKLIYPRQALHAYSLEFVPPSSEKKLIFTADFDFVL